jgi:two-component system, cell cycle response regulator
MGSTRAKAGAVYVVQSGRDELQLRTSRGLEGGGPLTARLKLGDGVTGRVAATGDAVRGRVGPDGLTLSDAEPAATELISVPLRATEGIIGVLNLYDREDGKQFDDADLDNIRSFAGQAAVALDNVLLHQEAQRLSVTDGLTGLGNYRFFQATLSREVERAARFHRSLAVLMLDLDLFKQVNDGFGHPAGDAVLVEVAQRLEDTVRAGEVLARVGGEEFAWLLPACDAEEAVAAADRARAAIASEPFGRAGKLTMSAGVGLVSTPSDGDALYRMADRALYDAKQSGRNRTCCHGAGVLRAAQQAS